MKYLYFLVLMSAISVPASANWFMKQFDANGDGRVTLREFRGTASRFRALDVNGDRVITEREARTANRVNVGPVRAERATAVQRKTVRTVPERVSAAKQRRIDRRKNRRRRSPSP
jgi:hypothetical protein